MRTIPGSRSATRTDRAAPPGAVGVVERVFSLISGGSRTRTSDGRNRLILAVTALSALFLSSCASVPPDRVALRSVDDVVTTVQAGMRAFNVLYQSGKFAEADREKVLAAYEKFQATAEACRKVARAATTPSEKGIAAQVAEAAAESLVALLKAYGVAWGTT